MYERNSKMAANMAAKNLNLMYLSSLFILNKKENEVSIHMK